MVSSVEELQKVHQIPETVFEKKGIYICKSNRRDVYIDDNGVTFEKLNIFLKKKKMVTSKELKKLDYVRKERNKLHLQSLSIRDIGYTKVKFNKLAEPVDFLSEKLKVFNL